MTAIAIICQKLPMKPALEFLSVGEIRPDPGWRMRPHFHLRHHELIVVLGGALVLKTAEEEIVAQHGDLLFYRSKFVHEEISVAANPVHILYVAIQGKAPDFPLRVNDGDGRVRQLASWLYADSRRGRPRRDCQILLDAVAGELRRLCAVPPDPWFEELQGWMRKRFASRLSLDDLARHGKMSRFAFIRRFRRLSGRTPMEELRRIRLHEARNLLLTQNLSLKEIAPAVGIGDEYQLSKLFRRTFGLSPRDMRSKITIPAKG
jgi:AraC-like DNA-binding protein